MTRRHDRLLAGSALTVDVEIHWRIDASTSCFHVVDCMLRQESLVDATLAEEMSHGADELSEIIGSSGLSSVAFLAHLVPQSAEIGNNRQLATVVATKTFGPQKTEGLVRQLADVISELEKTFDRLVPSAAAELAAAAAPLRQQWSTQGNELLSSVGRLTEPEVIVPSASIILVHPACGGGGRANLIYNSVCLEVVETEPIADLPELVRLGWLISQLNADMPMYQGEIHRDRLFEVASLAMIPVILEAAGELGLVQLEKTTFHTAVSSWLPNVANSSGTADALRRWWETYLNRKPRWTVALAALNEMLGDM